MTHRMDGLMLGGGLVGEGAAGAFNATPIVRVEVRGVCVIAFVVYHKGQISNGQPHIQRPLLIECLPQSSESTFSSKYTHIY